MFKFIFLLNVLTVYIPLFLMGFFMPNFTKKTLLFGIVIPEEVSSNEEVLNIQRIYKKNYALSSILISIIISAISVKVQSVHLLNLGIFILIANMIINYVYIHNKTKALKKEKEWDINKKQVVIVDTSHRHNQNYLSAYYFLIPISIVIFTIIFTIVQYPHLPEQIPTHFDLNGNITTYSNKSFVSVFCLPFTQVGMTVMFYLIYKMIQKVRPSIQASRPKISSMQNQIAKRYWAIYLLVTLVVINFQFAYIQLNVLQITNSKSVANLLVNGLAIFIPMVGVILVAIKTGQSGSRVKINEQEELNKDVIDRDDDKFWKWGMFYYNPDDPSLFIEKRFGIGWTINFGIPAGKIIITITLVAMVISLILPLI